MQYLFRPRLLGLVLVALLATSCTASSEHLETPILRSPDVLFVPTPPATVSAALRLAEVSPSDIVYDLGSGDGRVVIAAAREFGARGIGIEIDATLIARARVNAMKAGVPQLVRFHHQDLFLADIRQATVVFAYLLPDLNARLLPKLLKDLIPGTRVLFYTFMLPGLTPDRTQQDSRGRSIYLWRVPARSPTSRLHGSQKCCSG